MLEEFKAFCKSKGNTEYNYESIYNCAFAQFLISKGFYSPIVLVENYYNSNMERVYFSDEFRIALSSKDWTFPKLLERLETVRWMFL